MGIEPIELATIAAIFTLAGTVKGVTGLGLPTVSLALLTIAFDLSTAMVLLLIPSFVTNLWQAMIGGQFWLLLNTNRTFFLTASCTVWIGGLALSALNWALLSALLGFLLITYSAASLTGFRPQIGDQQKTIWGTSCGTLNGILTGMTGSFVVPGVLYLQALGLDRNALVQAMGILFTLSTISLGISLQSSTLLSVTQLGISSIAVAPALAGMYIGQQLRKNMSEVIFRKIFLITILLLGVYIIVNNILEF